MEKDGLLRRPIIPAHCEHNAHMYYVLLPRGVERQKVLHGLKKRGVHAVFHYVPLHTSPAGKRLARAHGELSHTAELSERLLRLPLWHDISAAEQEHVAESLRAELA